MKFAAALALCLLYALVLAIVYTVHVWFLPVDVVFYSAIGDGALAALIVSPLLLLPRKQLAFTGLERTLLLGLWLLAGYAFAISGPTVLDRSLSFYILEKLQQRGGGIRLDAIPQLFVKEYMPEFRLVDVRLTEQQQSGTIEIVDGCVRLTPRGQRLASFSRFIRTNLLPKHRLLAGVYTDALVDPFVHGAQGPQGYECK
jgi:hypothetical protein